MTKELEYLLKQLNKEHDKELKTKIGKIGARLYGGEYSIKISIGKDDEERDKLLNIHGKLMEHVSNMQRMKSESEMISYLRKHLGIRSPNNTIVDLEEYRK